MPTYLILNSCSFFKSSSFPRFSSHSSSLNSPPSLPDTQPSRFRTLLPSPPSPPPLPPLSSWWSLRTLLLLGASLKSSAENLWVRVRLLDNCQTKSSVVGRRGRGSEREDYWRSGLQSQWWRSQLRWREVLVGDGDTWVVV